MVDGVDQSITQVLEMGKDVTLLTGDKMSSAVEIGLTIGLIRHASDYVHLESIDDFRLQSTNSRDVCYVINGRLLAHVACSRCLGRLLGSGGNGGSGGSAGRRIIYRASPNGKQVYIEMLQKDHRRSTMMIGDGSNDLAALIQANVGVCIRHGDANLGVQNVAEWVIEDWTQIPLLLSHTPVARRTIAHLTQWVLMKHMITAFMLLSLLVYSGFQQVQDPISPFVMSGLNSVAFIAACLYCRYTGALGQ